MVVTEQGEVAHSPPRETDGILVVRRGPGANCSSIGSAVEMLFLSATAGAAILLAVQAALRETPDVTPPPSPPDAPPVAPEPPPDAP